MTSQTPLRNTRQTPTDGGENPTIAEARRTKVKSEYINLMIKLKVERSATNKVIKRMILLEEEECMKNKERTMHLV